MEIKTQVPDIVRAESGALLNKNTDALAAYKKQKAAAKNIKTLEDKVAELSERLSIVTQMVLELQTNFNKLNTKQSS